MYALRRSPGDSFNATRRTSRYFSHWSGEIVTMETSIQFEYKAFENICVEDGLKY
jgi:hypothetical protein